MTSPLLYIMFSACTFGYFLEADVIAADWSVERGSYDMSNIKLLHFQGKSYYLGTEFKTSFLQASMFCQMIHMQLVSIYSAAESDRLYNYIMNTIGSGNNLWSSGSRQVDGKTWLWLSTGETMKYKNWVPTQPDNTNKNERCIELAPENDGLYWNDVACETSRYFICEKYDDLPQESDDSSTSTDNNKCRPEVTCNQPQERLERKYRFSKTKATQGEAYLTCKQYGMELVSIPNKKNNDHIADLISRYNATEPYWTSAIKQSNGKWVWWNHQPLDFTNWDSMEPNNKKSHEFCLQLLPNGKWNDEICNLESYFICETLIEENSCYYNPQPIPAVNVYVNNIVGTVTNGSMNTCSCNGEENNADNDDPLYSIIPRIGHN